MIVFFFFFFSSRRRHTRYWRGWSSDVCSSDLRASLVGLASPLLSVALWAFALLLARGMGWDTSYPAIQRLITIGVWVPVIGTAIGLAGRPLLLLAIVPGSLGTVFFWYATTLP